MLYVGVHWRKEGAQLRKEGAQLGKEGAQLGMEGAQHFLTKTPSKHEQQKEKRKGFMLVPAALLCRAHFTVVFVHAKSEDGS